MLLTDYSNLIIVLTICSFASPDKLKDVMLIKKDVTNITKNRQKNCIISNYYESSNDVINLFPDLGSEKQLRTNKSNKTSLLMKSRKDLPTNKLNLLKIR